MQGALSALKDKQKKNAKAAVAFGASSPTLRDPIPMPIPIRLEEHAPSHTVGLGDSKEIEINGSKKRSDSTQNAKAGTIRTPVTTDRWRAKTRGYSTVPSGSKTGRMDPKSPGVSAQMLVRGAGSASTVHSIEMTAGQRLAVWSALLVLQSCLIGCEDTQRLTAEFGLHEPLAALLKLASNWGSIVSLLSPSSSTFISSSHSLRRKNLLPAAWCPSQFHIVSSALAASCAFTSSSSSSSSSRSSSSSNSNGSSDVAREMGRFVWPIIFLCVYVHHIILCPVTLSHQFVT